MNLYNNQYDTDDFEPQKKTEAVTVGTFTKGKTIEIDINGKKIEMVNPEFMADVQKIVADLSNKLINMDRNVASLVQTIRQQKREIDAMQLQLRNKIDRI